MSLVFDSVDYLYPGARQVLHSISMQVDTGELLAVIGPAAQGKSTLLKLVAGLETGHAGSILLNGQGSGGHAGAPARHRHGVPELCLVSASVGGGQRGLRHGAAQGRCRAAQRRAPRAAGAGRPGRACRTRRHPAVRGQQQRVALARALATIDPRALLLDEPLSALDANVRAYLRDQIRALQRRFGATTLLVTHDQEEALAMADRVAVLRTVVCCRSPRRTCCMSGRHAGPWPSSWGCPRCCPAGSPRRIASTWALPDWPRRRARARQAGRCMCWCVPSMSRPIRRLARPIVWRAGSAPCVIWAPSRATTSSARGVRALSRARQPAGRRRHRHRSRAYLPAGRLIPFHLPLKELHDATQTIHPGRRRLAPAALARRAAAVGGPELYAGERRCTKRRARKGCASLSIPDRNGPTGRRCSANSSNAIRTSS